MAWLDHGGRNNYPVNSTDEGEVWARPAVLCGKVATYSGGEGRVIRGLLPTGRRGEATSRGRCGRVGPCEPQGGGLGTAAPRRHNPKAVRRRAVWSEKASAVCGGEGLLKTNSQVVVTASKFQIYDAFVRCPSNMANPPDIKPPPPLLRNYLHQAHQIQ